MYSIIRSILFCFSPEAVHHFSMHTLRLFCSVGFIRKMLTKKMAPANSTLSKDFLQLKFKNPVGLGAGFDKNATYLRELEALGFGFVEIGTVTPLPQDGNEKPRVFRLPVDKALINRMGFNNDGVKVITERLRQWSIAHDKKRMSKNNPATKLIIGGNIGKNKITPNEEAWKDYEICFRELHPFVDYFVVNVSSPNTPGLRELQEKESLRKILSHLQTINATFRQTQNQKPILLKIAPDLTVEQLNDVIDLATEIKLDGLVVSNTTISREGLVTAASKVNAMGAGGLSGLPVQKRSTEILNYISEKTKGALPIIASGGIFTAEDAKEKINAGASLVQVWTGFVYEGPAIVKKICKSL